MEYNYNRILEDIRQLVNKSVFIWLTPGKGNLEEAGD